MCTELEAQGLEGVYVDGAVLHAPEEGHDECEGVVFLPVYGEDCGAHHGQDDGYVEHGAALGVVVVDEPAHEKGTNNLTNAKYDHRIQRILVLLILFQMPISVLLIAIQLEHNYRRQYASPICDGDTSVRELYVELAHFLGTNQIDSIFQNLLK